MEIVVQFKYCLQNSSNNIEVSEIGSPFIS